MAVEPLGVLIGSQINAWLESEILRYILGRTVTFPLIANRNMKIAQTQTMSCDKEVGWRRRKLTRDSPNVSWPPQLVGSLNTKS